MMENFWKFYEEEDDIQPKNWESPPCYPSQTYCPPSQPYCQPSEPYYMPPNSYNLPFDPYYPPSQNYPPLYYPPPDPYYPPPPQQYQPPYTSYPDSNPDPYSYPSEDPYSYTPPPMPFQQEVQEKEEDVPKEDIIDQIRRFVAENTDKDYEIILKYDDHTSIFPSSFTVRMNDHIVNNTSDVCSDRNQEEEEKESPEEQNDEKVEEECPLLDTSTSEEEHQTEAEDESKSEMSISKPLISSIPAYDVSYDFVIPLDKVDLKMELKIFLNLFEQEKRSWMEMRKKEEKRFSIKSIWKRKVRDWEPHAENLLDREAKRLRYNGKEDRYPWPFR